MTHVEGSLCQNANPNIVDALKSFATPSSSRSYFVCFIRFFRCQLQSRDVVFWTSFYLHQVCMVCMRWPLILAHHFHLDIVCLGIEQLPLNNIHKVSKHEKGLLHYYKNKNQQYNDMTSIFPIFECLHD